MIMTNRTSNINYDVIIVT